MINKETVRIGAVRSELDAARIYDFLAILTEGLIVSIHQIYIQNLQISRVLFGKFYQEFYLINQKVILGLKLILIILFSIKLYINC